MLLSQQATGAQFDYQTFKSEIQDADLTPSQLAPLNQRVASLESFMPRMENRAKGRKLRVSKGTLWENKPGLLTIVDLSCPYISPEQLTRCLIFV
ncbi:uncharacterized protein CC84DRAFT_835182 [Paraphaeosphaeria sporulosa]|uniref:Uncharacterized protein n=1 Tax=Paraphaeosphaeria sporulosa TaxID=1460663 RepID=A0A177CCH2_9PLEO|nr:uncharacterized protein CC84DRAFT_835182 [Paraphaeosphaeria sporulosa]OAG05354.1 hypothetical protein CC84DRAFT_835182 [Paraphaeosphaeria sporulosa]